MIPFINDVLTVAISKKSTKKEKAAVPALITSEIQNTWIDICRILRPFAKLSDALQGHGVTSSLAIAGIIAAVKSEQIFHFLSNAYKY